MGKNIGSFDKLCRLLAVFTIFVLFLGGHLTGTLSMGLGVFAMVTMLTCMAGFCPFYPLLGIDTTRYDGASCPLPEKKTVVEKNESCSLCCGLSFDQNS